MNFNPKFFNPDYRPMPDRVEKGTSREILWRKENYFAIIRGSSIFSSLIGFVKVSKSQKQITVSSIFPKNKQKNQPELS